MACEMNFFCFVGDFQRESTCNRVLCLYADKHTHGKAPIF